LAAYALTVLIGLSLGALGSGGAILMLPLLVYAAAIPVGQAVPMSLAVVAVTSAAGALGYVRDGSFNPRLALVFGLGGVGGAFAGSMATHMVPHRVLMLLFSTLLLFVGVRMLVSRQPLTCPNPCLPPRCFLIAFGIGLLTGFLGVGGGFLLVPALMRFAGLTQRPAVGTSLALISANSVSGLLGHLRYTTLDWQWTGGFLVFALLGLGLGLMVAKQVPAATLQRVFAVLLVGIGLGIGLANTLSIS
jgi:uncharacterized membrane protein YfcA